MVEAQVTFFQSGIQLNVRRLRQAKEGEYDPKDYIPTSDKDIEVMYKELLAYISGITQPHLRKLAEKYFVENANFVKNFKEHSAAKSVHHSFLGGLLEHTLGILKLCEVYVMQYPILNKDLLYTAAMFHDVGKLVEISNFPENDYTDDGQLLGHIIIGVEWLNETMKQIDGFPPKLASMLKHCILSHHGELEYGSPKKPAIIEAIALHMADNTDSKLMTFNEILQSGTEEKGDWLGYNRLFESNLRKTVF
jgi:3'-5' exoribonuclease